jgi:hypothetical protein
MRKAGIAEAILSLTTSGDHAAAIAGDLVQQAPLKGAMWFWGSVVRTTTSLTWKAFTEAPLRVTGLALLGMLLHMFYIIVIQVPIILLHLGLSGELSTARRPVPSEPAEFNFTATAGWEYMFAFLVASYLIGRWLAKRAPQRELAVYVGVWFVAHMLWIPMLMLIPGLTFPVPSLSDLAMDVAATVIGGLGVFAGVRSMRRRMAPVGE